MSRDLETGGHATYALQYHLVLVVNQHREVFTDERTQFFQDVVSGFADDYGVAIRSIEGGGDHIQLLFAATPTTDLAKFVNVLKGAAARRLRSEYGDELESDSQSDAFWTDSYCLLSTGQVSPTVLTDYIESQRERADR